jgi:glycine amidinotransferase
MPRDLLLVIGDIIIEAPLSWRSRYFEIDSYRELLRDYFARGAKWISAPRPELLDDLFDENFDAENLQTTKRFVVNEFEPVFDAADFIRCGRDIFVQRSHVTNIAGIEWVRRHIPAEYKIHMVEITDNSPMHIDATFMPLAPGKLLLNRERITEVPKALRSWEVQFAPESTIPADHTMYMSSTWVSMNVVMLDPKTVVVEAQEHPTMELLSKWGFEVVPVPFRNVMRFGGAFHCVTCDVRRAGTLQSYR